MCKLEVQFRDEWLHRYSQVSRQATNNTEHLAHLVPCYAFEGLAQLIWRGLILGDINLWCDHRVESVITYGRDILRRRTHQEVNEGFKGDCAVVLHKLIIYDVHIIVLQRQVHRVSEPRISAQRISAQRKTYSVDNSETCERSRHLALLECV